MYVLDLLKRLLGIGPPPARPTSAPRTVTPPVISPLPRTACAPEREGGAATSSAQQTHAAHAPVSRRARLAPRPTPSAGRDPAPGSLPHPVPPAAILQRTEGGRAAAQASSPAADAQERHSNAGARRALGIGDIGARDPGLHGAGSRDAGARDTSDRGGDPNGDVVARYFELSMAIERGKADRDYRAAVHAARDTYPLLPAVVRAIRREYGHFDIATSHAVHTAPTLMAVLEDADGIRELRAALEGVRELRDWLPAAEQAEDDLALVPGIMAAVGKEPGLVQSTLKTRLGLADGSRASQLAAWLEKAGRLYRVKKGSSYQLYPAGYVIPAVAQSMPHPPLPASPSSSSPRSPTPTQPTVLPGAPTRPPRAWTRRPAVKARLLDFSGLHVVRLPMAPPAWEERGARADSETVWNKWVADAHERAAQAEVKEGLAKREKNAEPRFVVEGRGWTVTSEEKLAPAERPDPAFKHVFHTGRYTHWLDPKGKRERFEYAASVLRVTDRHGQTIAERGIARDVYRSDVNADGTGILFLAREGILHGYTETLEPVLEARLLDLPEYQAQAERLGIEPRELKNHTRCVAISTDRSRYLVTVVDEAWCLETASGEVLWGVRMPTKEGWTRSIADRSERAGTSAEVEAALRRMELELPVTPADITRQYRTLAMRWHPDRNAGDSTATARFQELGAAMELLTGADLSRLSGGEIERVTYEQVLSTVRVTVPDGLGGVLDTGISFSVTMGVSETFASDWIYAANLGRDGRAFLAGYSGKVVVVSPTGIPERVYDIGAVPRHIVDAGEHLYILTDTRLYVLAGDRLEALVDVYGAGDVVVADRGFALLEPKALTWFTPSGQRIGAVRTKDPLRRAVSVPRGMIVETRQHRAIVHGAPSWWTD